MLKICSKQGGGHTHSFHVEGSPLVAYTLSTQASRNLKVVTSGNYHIPLRILNSNPGLKPHTRKPVPEPWVRILNPNPESNPESELSLNPDS